MYAFTLPSNDPGPILPSEIIISAPSGQSKKLMLAGFLTPNEIGYHMRIQLCNNHNYLEFLEYVKDMDMEDFKQATVQVKQGMFTILSFPLTNILAEPNPTLGERPRSDWKRMAFADVKDINDYPCSLTFWAGPDYKMYIGCRREG